MADTTATALDFAPSITLAETRQYKLLRIRETHNTCTYCSVDCGLLTYSLGDGTKNARASIFHIKDDPGHPINRGALCPKGAGLMGFIRSEGRLRFPECRTLGPDRWQQISWGEAFDRIAKPMKEDRDTNYIAQNAEGVTVNRWLSTGMLCASAPSNETDCLTQKFSHVLSILVIDNQARIQHGPTMASLAPILGRGVVTNRWVDIRDTNLVVMMGDNATEAHLVGFRQTMEAKIHNGAKLIVIGPRSTCMAVVTDYYVPIRSGVDTAFLSGALLYLLDNEKFNHEYIEAYTNTSLIVRGDYGLEDDLFTDYDTERRKYGRSTRIYELNENGFTKRNTTLQHPHCVWNLLKQYVSRYASDMAGNICGTPKDTFLKVYEYVAEVSAHDKTASLLHALDWT